MKRHFPILLHSVVSLSVALAAATSMGQGLYGKIHGHVTDPTGVPKTEGTVSLSLDAGHTLKYSFPVSATGDYSGEGIKPDTYSVILRLPETPPGKLVDEIDEVKIVAGEDIKQDVDMSRKAYTSKLTADQRKQIEDFKKKNAAAVEANQAVKGLNSDLATARADNHDKKYDEAEALMTKDTTGDPPSAELLWYELGIAQLGLKKWDPAVASFQKTLEMATAAKKANPDLLGGAQAGLGEAYARNQKVEDAATQYDLAAKSNPVKASFYLTNETIIFSQVGNPDAQAAAADKAIAADPKSPLPYYLKGQALASKISVDKSGAYILPPGCAEAYNKYLELDPTGKYAAESKAILDASQTKVESKYKAKK